MFQMPRSLLLVDLTPNWMIISDADPSTLKVCKSSSQQETSRGIPLSHCVLVKSDFIAMYPLAF